MSSASDHEAEVRIIARRAVVACLSPLVGVDFALAVTSRFL